MTHNPQKERRHMPRNQQTPHGGTALLKFKLLNGERLPHPKPLAGPVLPYQQLRDPAKHNTRREATEGRRTRAYKGPAQEVDIRSLNGGKPGKGKSPGNKYANLSRGNWPAHASQRRTQ
jgi:hypothetical protein